jgi:hypothetical protein
MNLVIATPAFENESFMGPPATEPVLEDAVRGSSPAEENSSDAVRLSGRTLLKALDEDHADPAGKGRGGDRGNCKPDSSGAGEDKGER